MHKHVHKQTQILKQPEMHWSQLWKLRPLKSPTGSFTRCWTNARSSYHVRAHIAPTTNTHSACFAWQSARTTTAEVPHRFHTSFSLVGKKKIKIFQARTCTDADIKTSCTVSCGPSWMSHWWTGDGESVIWHGQYRALSGTQFTHACSPSVSTKSLCTHWQTFPPFLHRPAQRSRAQAHNNAHNEKPHLAEPSKCFLRGCQAVQHLHGNWFLIKLYLCGCEIRHSGVCSVGVNYKQGAHSTARFADCY